MGRERVREREGEREEGGRWLNSPQTVVTSSA